MQHYDRQVATNSLLRDFCFLFIAIPSSRPVSKNFSLLQALLSPVHTGDYSRRFRRLYIRRQRRLQSPVWTGLLYSLRAKSGSLQRINYWRTVKRAVITVRATMHSVTDRRTGRKDGRTDRRQDYANPIADHIVWQYDRLKITKKY